MSHLLATSRWPVNERRVLNVALHINNEQIATNPEVCFWNLRTQEHCNNRNLSKYLADDITLLCVEWNWFKDIHLLISDHFMPPPLGAGGIMFSGSPSVRPSVRSLKYPLLTCTWVRWSSRPTVTVLQHVCPSVRLSVHPSGEVSGHLPENAWRE